MRGFFLCRHLFSVDPQFKFYYDFVKPLYSEIQTRNELPYETLFELNAAFDHVSRIYTYDEPETKSVEKAYGHLKRSCLDIFKIRLRDASEQFDELIKVNTSVIDNGKFDSELISLYNEIKKAGTEARLKEGQYKATGEIDHAFELWQPVFEKCIKLEEEFYNNPNVSWAQVHQNNAIDEVTSRLGRKNIIIAIIFFVIGVIAKYVISLL